MPVYPYTERDHLLAVLLGVRMTQGQYQRVCEVAQRGNITPAAVIRSLIDRLREAEDVARLAESPETALGADVERALG